MQKVYYAVRCWCHTEKGTQTINARKCVSSRSRHEHRAAKVLQSENQSKGDKSKHWSGLFNQAPGAAKAGMINL